MKVHDKLDEILSSGSRVKVLRYLFREDDENTGRAIARAVGLSPSMAHLILSALTSEGLVEAREKGKARLFSLRRRSHIVQKLLRPLFEAEETLYKDLIKDLKSGILSAKQEVIAIAIFGSVASRRETERSDLDLLVVTQNALGKQAIQRIIDELSIRLAEKNGITLSPYVVTRRELKKKRDQKLPLVKSILSNNQLIYGEPIERILA